jgi:hypothetical protein
MHNALWAFSKQWHDMVTERGKLGRSNTGVSNPLVGIKKGLCLKCWLFFNFIILTKEKRKICAWGGEGGETPPLATTYTAEWLEIRPNHGSAFE